MKSNISMKQLQAIESVARLGSFTQAAKELGISQPSVSNLIYSLEKQFKCRMFDRSGSEITPTHMLEDIRGQIKAIIALKDELEHHLVGERDLEMGKFNIGYTTYQLSMPIISEFVHRFPGVNVTARAMASDDLLKLLFRGEFDVTFITGREIPAGLEGTKIAPAKIGLIVPDDHTLASRKSLTWKDVDGLDLVQREPSSGTRKTFEAAAKVAGIKVKTKLGLGSWGSIMELVRSGVGIGVGFEREFVKEVNLTFLPIEDKNLEVHHFVVCLPAMRHTSSVKQFFQISLESL